MIIAHFILKYWKTFRTEIQIALASREGTKLLELRDLIWREGGSEPVFSDKLRYIAGFRFVEMVISPNQNPTIYRNLYKHTSSVLHGINPQSAPW